MRKLLHTAKQYWSFADVHFANPTNCAKTYRHALRLKTLALIAEDRGHD